ncbi:MAG: NAD(P)H-hydrate epimerase [Phycisphaeraceae bacterium]|nr:NAD(P)H-hydrate epimerase [Phycisphaeraceae bacterium]
MARDAEQDDRGLSVAQSRRIDEIAAAWGLATMVLMENAGRAMAEAAVRAGEARGLESVVVVAGPGNNGGDGLVAARWLINAGREVAVVHLAERSGGDAAVHRGVLERMGVPGVVWGGDGVGTGLTKAGRSVVLDCVFGTGLSRAPEGNAAGAIGWINGMRERGSWVIAADVPSGLDADSGRALGACVRADETVAFVARKRGFGAPGAGEWLGRVTVADIGVPRAIVDRVVAEGRA